MSCFEGLINLLKYLCPCLKSKQKHEETNISFVNSELFLVNEHNDRKYLNMDALKELEEIVIVKNHQYNREGIYDNSIGYDFKKEFRYTRDNLSTITEESDSKLKFILEKDISDYGDISDY